MVIWLSDDDVGRETGERKSSPVSLISAADSVAFIPSRGYESETERGKVEMEMDRQRMDDGTGVETGRYPSNRPTTRSAIVRK